MHNPTIPGNSASSSLDTGIGPIVAGPIARGEASPPTAHAARDFHSFLADIEELIKDANSLTGDDQAQAKFKLSARIATAKAAAEAGGNSLMQRARQTAAVTNGYVREQPWKAVGAGAALAFLLGRAITRRG
ncbi:DUF883 family protein [Aquipseudomonas guryensis]|uniref:DUF883 domain-containing protein n=1 Tax=Aquipseudomonas guryensis TaxID=2759165 RepID=A0A7W4DDG9_9GAMM|nr:DUF883 family protein [Pseudomonas guryensis]MBB1520533.1 DUF883 domain-containing protein [Pseudomonas guryensis]